MHFIFSHYPMLFVFLAIVLMLTLHATEKFPSEGVSFFILVLLIVFFYFNPVINQTSGANALGIQNILKGFVHPALITILSLLVIGEALCQTGVLDLVGEFIFSLSQSNPLYAYILAIIMIVFTSSVLNNVPTVVIFIPIMRALAQQCKKPTSLFMMPISFASIMGGMLTMIGSSTNILVAGIVEKLHCPPLSFFSFTVPALAIVSTGLIYMLFIMPKLLPTQSQKEDGTEEKHFLMQLIATPGSRLIGTNTEILCKKYPSLTFKHYYRNNTLTYYTKNEHILEHDTFVLMASKSDLAKLLVAYPEAFYGNNTEHTPHTQLHELMITPQSPLIGKLARTLNFRKYYNIPAVAIDCRMRSFSGNLTNISIDAGDILLVKGSKDDIKTLKSKHFVSLDHNTLDFPQTHHKWPTLFIFIATIAAAAANIVPTSVATVAGALSVMLIGSISVKNALKSLDTKIIFLIASALALGRAMDITGGTTFITNVIINHTHQTPPAIILSIFFLLVALISNVLSTKATAVLFAPISVYVARSLHVPVEPFAIAVIFAANCAFATPIGYQTNLLVMAPGRYKFSDFIIAGLPLILITWIVFSLFMPLWYHIPY